MTPAFIAWLEGLCQQLDCPPPEPDVVDDSEYFRKLGAWETQMIILKKLRFAIRAEKQLMGSLQD